MTRTLLTRLRGRPLVEQVWTACHPQRNALSALTYQLGEWTSPGGERSFAGDTVDAAIAACLDQAATTGRKAGHRAGARLGLVLGLVVLLLGLLVGAVAR